MTAHWMRTIVYNVSWAVDSKAVPFLHGSSVYILLGMLEEMMIRQEQLLDLLRGTHIKSHPRNGLIMWYFGSLDQLQGQCLVIELDSKDGSWWCPGAYHQMVQHSSR